MSNAEPPRIEDIYALIARETGLSADDLRPDTDLFGPGGPWGDDCDALLKQFATRYSVDMSSYRWYFHHCEEWSFNPGAWIFKPPNRRVTRLPVTPQLLLQAAGLRRWPLEYPPHKLPARRYDIWLTYTFIALVVLGILTAQYFSRSV